MSSASPSLGNKKIQSVLEVTNQLRKSGSVEKREVENQAFGPFGSICSETKELSDC